MNFKIKNFIRMIVGLLIASGAFSATAMAAELQKPKLKQGYYFSVIPVGEVVWIDSEQNYGPWPAVGGQFRLGEEINRWFDLGIAGGTSVAKGNNYRLIHGNFGLDATFKPTEFWSMGFQAGLGFADFSRTQSGMETITGRFGATYGFKVAYDFFLGGNRDVYKSGGWALSPYLGTHIGPGNVSSVYSIFMGISINYWTGLPKNRLDLPPERAF